MKNYNREFMRDIACQQAVTQRPGNRAFWADPEVGQAEWAVNRLLAELATGEHEVREYIPPVAGH